MIKPGQYRVIRVNGSDEVVDQKPTLKRIYASIDADRIDIVTLSWGAGHITDLVMLADDTGRIDGKPVNEKASEIAGVTICGDVAIVHDQDFA
jgi:hypothetical protein